MIATALQISAQEGCGYAGTQSKAEEFARRNHKGLVATIMMFL